MSPTDFDGDGCLDVLIITGSGIPGSSVKAYVYWGNMKSLGMCTVCTKTSGTTVYICESHC